LPSERTTGGAHPEAAASTWAPFRHAAFTVLWTAAVFSNVGTWMHDVAAGWLMTSLAPTPLMVALVQSATTLPIFLFALPAGTLADLVDRRRLLIGVMSVLAVAAALLGLLASLELVTPWLLLGFTFLFGTGAAFVAPAWQAIVPQLVPRAQLQPAVALNSMGINISRAIGPSLAGLIIAGFGIAWPFFANALSFVAVIAALLWWRPPPARRSPLPGERFWSGLRTGLRFARASGPLRATLLRAVAFFLFASAYWALLPLIARQELNGGPALYGTILGAVGLGAVLGAIAMPRVKRYLGADGSVAAGTAGTALVLVVFALVRRPEAAVAASIVAGASWIAVLSSLNVSAQLALPDWVRARGLSAFIMVFFGAMTLGSLLWGQTASFLGIPATLLIAAGGALAAALLARPFRLQQGQGLDHTPSSHWPAPVTAREVAPDSGPVMVTIDYRIAPQGRAAFLAIMSELEAARRRDGAFAWNLFEDAALPGRFVEHFLEESWLAHLRHHERVSAADRTLQARVRALHLGPADPEVTHFTTPEA
jgi:MFS family permease